MARQATLTGADVRAERMRHQPPVGQEEVRQVLGWNERGMIGHIENGDLEVTQSQLQKMLDAIEKVAQKRSATKAGV